MNADRVILGENAVYSTDSSVTGLNNNVLVCGGSGSGKTMSVSESRLLETCHSSLIATVTKRRIVNRYKPLFEQRGYTVEDLNFTHPEESSIAFDPLQYVKSHTDISFLAKSVVMANPRKEKSDQDPFWDDSAASLLSAEIAYTLMTKKNASFSDVLALHDRLDFQEAGGEITTSMDDQFYRIAKQDPDCFALSCWRSFRKLPVRTAGCTFSALNTTLDRVFTPELRKMMALENKLDFRQLARQKTLLFVTSSPVNTSLHSFVNLFYAQAFKSLFDYAESLPDNRLPIPVHILCDDFATGSPIPNFAEYISVFREAQISVTLLIQSESQLESLYGSSEATTIINNCDSYLYLGGMDLKTGRSVSERLNLPLEEVLYMPVGREYLFRRGEKPLKTRRYDITRDERYVKLRETDGKEADGR